MKTNPKLCILPVLALALVWIVLTPQLVPQAATQPKQAPHKGFLAPGFKLDALGGEVMDLTDLSGKVVLLNFWASWCPPCRAEMPAIQAVYKTYRGEGLGVVAVNMAHQDSREDVSAFVEAYQLTFPVLLDQQGETATRYRVRALPTTFLIGRDGVIREVLIGGPLSEALLAAKIEALIQEGE